MTTAAFNQYCLPFYSIIGDGSGDSYNDLLAASAQSKPVALYNGTIVCNHSITPRNAFYFFGGILQPANGINIDLTDSTIIAPPGSQLFDLSAGGTISGNPDIEFSYSTWWGADPTYSTGSNTAMQAWLDFSVGSRKPKPCQVPGRYKLAGGSTTALLSVATSSFNLPMIYGVPGQPHTLTTSGYNCVWDASTSTLVADANGNFPAVLRINGGAGSMISGGARDFGIIGNGVCNGIQVADAGGVVIDNMRMIQVRYGVELYNEDLGSAPLTSGYNLVGGGFTENVKILNCAIGAGLAGVRTRRNVNGGFTASATNSFHRLTIENTWIDIGGGVANGCGLFVGVGCDIYNANLNFQTFFSGVTPSIRQYAIGFEQVTDARMPQIPVKASGMLTEEGGAPSSSAYCFWGGPYGSIYWTGAELGVSAMRYGSLIPCHAVYRYGTEAGSANGSVRAQARPWSFGPVNINSGAAIFYNFTQDGLYNISLDLSATNYDRRMTAEIWSIAGLTGNVNVQTNWAVDNTAGYGTPGITCNNETLVLTQQAAATSAVKSGGNTGNGTCTVHATVPLLNGTLPGIYKVRCVNAVTNGGLFEVRDPKDEVVGSAVVGVLFIHEVQFTIADGSTDFIVGDGFDITVGAGSAVWPTRSAASAVKSGGNTGNGTLTMDATTPVAGCGINGVYQVRCTATGVGGGTFRVTMPNGWPDTIALTAGGGTILSPDLVMSAGAGTWSGQGLRSNGSIKFALAAGGVAFAVGDGFDVTVSGGIAVSVGIYPKYTNRASLPNGFNTMSS